MLSENWWPCGATDKASDYESGDSRSESWQGVIFCLMLRYTLYLIFTAIIIFLKFVALWPNGKGI